MKYLLGLLFVGFSVQAASICDFTLSTEMDGQIVDKHEVNAVLLKEKNLIPLEFVTPMSISDNIRNQIKKHSYYELNIENHSQLIQVKVLDSESNILKTDKVRLSNDKNELLESYQFSYEFNFAFQDNYNQREGQFKVEIDCSTNIKTNQICDEVCREEALKELNNELVRIDSIPSN